MNPGRGWSGLPVGWAEGVPPGARVAIASTAEPKGASALAEESCVALERFFRGETLSLEEWVRCRCGARKVFETTAIEAELSLLRQWGVIRNKVSQ